MEKYSCDIMALVLDAKIETSTPLLETFDEIFADITSQSSVLAHQGSSV